MNYPINVEKYIFAMRLEFGPNEAAEEAHRVIIPVVNSAHLAGVKGTGGYPLDLDQEIKFFAQHTGKSVSKKLIQPLVAWVNQAYEQGVKDGEAAQG